MIGKQVIYLPECDSTNLYANNLLSNKMAEHGTIIRTDFQRKGKGYHKNSWSSEPGKNILLSLIIVPESIKPEEQFYISKFTSIAILKFLQHYHHSFSIKWPNDIYYEDSKICGILIENGFTGQEFSYSVVGIGININQLSFPAEIPNPASLSSITGEYYKVDLLTDELIHSMDHIYDLVINRDMELLDSLYLDNLYLTGKKSTFKADHAKFEGIILGVDDFGRLIIELAGGEKKTFGFKEVSYCPA